jgi:hypothetical protein
LMIHSKIDKSKKKHPIRLFAEGVGGVSLGFGNTY